MFLGLLRSQLQLCDEQKPVPKLNYNQRFRIGDVRVEKLTDLSFILFRGQTNLYIIILLFK